MLGISLYPDKTKFEDDIHYLQIAQSLGYQRVFMSMLQIDINDPQKSIHRLKESIQGAHELGFLVTLDIHPMVFNYIKTTEDDLSYFHQLGVDTLRLDSGYNGRTEAMMTHNPFGIDIELNMSNQTHYLELIQDYCPDYHHLRASHNFYPQRYTGLSLKSFQECSKHFQEAHIPTAAFLTSQSASVSPWPISEGLCTLEQHRDLSLSAQARHMKMLNRVDDWIIGNAYASEEELKILQDIYYSSYDMIHVVFHQETTDLEKEMICTKHVYRGDASEYVIRSSRNKQKYTQKALPAHLCDDIHRGDIMILNEDYGQYKGEVQIALKDRQSHPCINVVGHIKPEEMILLDLLKPFQLFELKEEKL